METHNKKVEDELHNIYKQIDSLDNSLTNLTNIIELRLKLEYGLISLGDVAKELGIDKDKHDRERLGI